MRLVLLVYPLEGLPRAHLCSFFLPWESLCGDEIASFFPDICEKVLEIEKLTPGKKEGISPGEEEQLFFERKQNEGRLRSCFPNFET